MAPRAGVAAGMLMIFGLLVGCGSSTPTEKALSDSHTTLPENLIFNGMFKGVLTQGINAHGIRHAQPNPLSGFGVFAQTSCAMYQLGDDAGGGVAGTQEWEADIYGRVGKTLLVLRITLEAYGSISGEHDIFDRNVVGTNSGEVEVDTIDGSTSLTKASVDSTVTVNKNETSGSLNLGFDDGPLTIKGTWRCA